MSVSLPDVTLRQLNRATTLASLLSSLLHDLNNTLLVIGGSVELLEGGALTEQQAVRLSRIRIQQEKLAGTVRALATMVSSSEPAGSRADIRAVVQQAIDLRRSAHGRRGILVRVAGEADSLTGCIEAGALLQIVLNLLTNAESAVADTEVREIVLTCQAADGYVVLTVTDTGSGVPQPLAGLLFEPFVSGAPAGVATGLGLAVSRQLAEAAGGTLTQTTQGAAGTCFELRLPLALG